jgi:hypothetical protein
MLEGAKKEPSQRACGVRVKALADGHAGEVAQKLEIEVTCQRWSHPQNSLSLAHWRGKRLGV